jgi:hypothetical protein
VVIGDLSACHRVETYITMQAPCRGSKYGVLDISSVSHLLCCSVQCVGRRDASDDLNALEMQHQQLPHGQHTAQVLFDQLLCKAPLIYLSINAQLEILIAVIDLVSEM